MWLAELSAEQRRTLLGLAHNVVVSDGLLDPNEEGMIAAFRREMSLDDTAAPDYLELDGIEAVFSGFRQRCIAIVNLLLLSYADGAFEIEEECLLKDVAARFEIGDELFLLLDNWVRRYLALKADAEVLFTASTNGGASD